MTIFEGYFDIVIADVVMADVVMAWVPRSFARLGRIRKVQFGLIFKTFVIYSYQPSQNSYFAQSFTVF